MSFLFHSTVYHYIFDYVGVELPPYGFVQVVSLCVRSNLLEGEGVEFGEECTAHERKGK